MVAVATIGMGDVTATNAEQVANQLRGTNAYVIIIDDYHFGDTACGSWIPTNSIEVVQPFRFFEPKPVYPRNRKMNLNYKQPAFVKKHVLNKNALRRRCNNKTQTL